MNMLKERCEETLGFYSIHFQEKKKKIQELVLASKSSQAA